MARGCMRRQLLCTSGSCTCTLTLLPSPHTYAAAVSIFLDGTLRAAQVVTGAGQRRVLYVILYQSYRHMPTRLVARCCCPLTLLLSYSSHDMLYTSSSTSLR
jgi:hypothetical protein